MDDLDCQGDQPTPEKQAETRYEQAHYKCEPATTIEELEAVARFAKSSSLRLVSYGCQTRPGLIRIPSGIIDVRRPGRTHALWRIRVLQLAHGRPAAQLPCRFRHPLRSTCPPASLYAICDLYCPAARVDNEYNGIGHELQNTRIHDGNRNNGLKAMGIHVLVINRDQMKDLCCTRSLRPNDASTRGSPIPISHQGLSQASGRLAQRSAGRNRPCAGLNGESPVRRRAGLDS